MSGYISLWRSLTKHWLWQDKPFTKGQAWIDILFECNHSDQKILIKDKLILCKRGESIKSLDTWAKRWGWNKSKVRRFLKMLENDTMVVLLPEQKTTHLKVLYYNEYQNKRNVSEPKVKRKRNDSETIPTPNNNYKNDNNVNNGNNRKVIPPILEDVINYFTERKCLNKEEPEKFFDFYTCKNWMVGKNKMVDWQATVRNWLRGKDFKKKKNNLNVNTYENVYNENYDLDGNISPPEKRVQTPKEIAYHKKRNDILKKHINKDSK